MQAALYKYAERSGLHTMSGMWVQFMPMTSDDVAVPDEEKGVLYVRDDATETEIGQAVLDHVARSCPRQRGPSDPSE